MSLLFLLGGGVDSTPSILRKISDHQGCPQQTMKREAPGSSNSESEALSQKKQKQEAEKTMSEEKMDVTATADGK